MPCLIEMFYFRGVQAMAGELNAAMYYKCMDCIEQR